MKQNIKKQKKAIKKARDEIALAEHELAAMGASSHPPTERMKNLRNAIREEIRAMEENISTLETSIKYQEYANS